MRQAREALAIARKAVSERVSQLYNHHIPQRAIGSKTPSKPLEEWQRQKPDLFVKRGCEHAGLDI